MDLSLIISTRNRAAQLRRCLAAVAEIKSVARWEVIVVDNNSADETPTVIAEFVNSAPIPVVPVQEPHPGVGLGRNAGLAAARGALVAFTDDDCYPAQDYVDQALAVFQDPRIGFAGGRITLYDADDYPITIKDSQTAQFFPPSTYLAGGEIHGANMMFRKCVLDEIHGFDHAFGPGGPFYSGEDVDLCGRASFAGWWGAYAPGPVVAHHHGRKAKDVQALKRGYAIGRGAYLAKFALQRASAAQYRRVCLYRLTHFVSLGPRNMLQEMYGAALYLRHWAATQIRRASESA
jgi:GT2 family glycosyltransferase